MKHNLCDACETCAWCSKFGCIPLTPVEPAEQDEPTCWDVIRAMYARYTWSCIGAGVGIAAAAMFAAAEYAGWERLVYALSGG